MLRDGEVLVVGRDGEARVSDWDEEVDKVAFEGVPPPDWIVALDPETLAVRRLEDRLDDHVNLARRESAEEAEHQTIERRLHQVL